VPGQSVFWNPPLDLCLIPLCLVRLLGGLLGRLPTQASRPGGNGVARLLQVA
jgi:hypothetical protein